MVGFSLRLRIICKLLIINHKKKISMKKRCIIKKYSAILAITVSAVLFLPEVLFAKGAVIGYVWGNTVSDDQLNHLTHVMVSNLHTDEYGNLSNSPNWNNNWPSNWLDDLVGRAHQKGVKVSIDISGGSEFLSATNDYNRSTFVNNIVDFVNLHHLDGVDIDREWPHNDDWYQCVALLTDLKEHPDLVCKRISIVMSWYSPSYHWGNLPIPSQIWSTVDAIHLMTYGLEEETVSPWRWPTHSDAASSIGAIDAWANWGETKMDLAILPVKKN